MTLKNVLTNGIAAMKAERAAEIAHKLRYKMALGQYAVDLIADSILQACKEQKEADAKIMDEAADDVAEWAAYAPSYFKEKWNAELTIQKWRDRAKAIRSTE